VNKFIVKGRDGRLACRGWRGAPGTGFIWQNVTGAPPDYLLTWDTRSGAQQFASMNGGNVTTVMEHFYSPAHAAAI
jgi:hypothetical protein